MRWTLMLLLIAPLAGCVKGGDYCDLSKPMMFGNQSVIEAIADLDEPLLREIVTHNEKWDKRCGG